MDKSAFNIYKENCNKIATINEQSNQLYEEYKRVDAEYDARFREFDRQIEELRKQNSEIAETNFIFSFGEVLEEITKVAAKYGYETPYFLVDCKVLIENYGIHPEKARTLESCRNWIKNSHNDKINCRIVVRKNFDDRKKGEFEFRYAKYDLDFDMPMCDGSTLQDNLNASAEFTTKYNGLDSNYYTILKLNDGAIYNFPIAINLMEYANKNTEQDCGVIYEAFANLLERRNAENENGNRENNS